MQYFANRRSGFTLIELMITITIFAVLTAIIFSSFANERSRSAVKQAATQLQVDIQAAQNSAQSGIVYTGSPANRLPTGYGVEVKTGSGNDDRYVLFADGTGVAGSSSASNDRYDSTGVDGELVTRRNLALNVRVEQLRFADAACTTDATRCTSTRASITFPIPTSNSLNIQDAAGFSRDVVDIIFKQTKLNLCYAVSVRAATATINKRQLTTCP